MRDLAVLYIRVFNTNWIRVGRASRDEILARDVWDDVT